MRGLSLFKVAKPRCMQPFGAIRRRKGVRESANGELFVVGTGARVNRRLEQLDDRL